MITFIRRSPDKRVFAAQTADRFGKRRAVAAARFELDKFSVRLALLFEIAVRGDVAVLQHKNLVAAFLDVAQQMRRQEYARPAAVADLSNKRDHAAARRRIEAVGRFVQDDQLAARARSPVRVWQAASSRASNCRPAGNELRPGRRKRELRVRVRARDSAGMPESSAISRTKWTHDILAINESRSGM